MHPTDGNLHAIERHLAEIEANTIELREGYCGTCDVFHELPVDQGNCPECDDDLHDDKDNWRTAQEGPK